MGRGETAGTSVPALFFVTALPQPALAPLIGLHLAEIAPLL
jgi:hypothetical protein